LREENRKGENMNTLEFDRLLLRLKRADSDNEKAVLYKDLSEEAKALSDSLAQQGPGYGAFEIKSDGTF
jgi:hypothetical protein